MCGEEIGGLDACVIRRLEGGLNESSARLEGELSVDLTGGMSRWTWRHSWDSTVRVRASSRWLSQCPKSLAVWFSLPKGCQRRSFSEASCPPHQSGYHTLAGLCHERHDQWLLSPTRVHLVYNSGQCSLLFCCTSGMDGGSHIDHYANHGRSVLVATSSAGGALGPPSLPQHPNVR